MDSGLACLTSTDFLSPGTLSEPRWSGEDYFEEQLFEQVNHKPGLTLTLALF